MANYMHLPTQEKLIVGGGHGGEETVDQLLEKLAKKGKKVKLVDEESIFYL